MKKTPSIIFVIAVFYVLPLLGRAAFIIHPQILFLMLACSLLFWTQPAISLNEAEAQKPADQSSVFWILIATSLSQIAAVVEWAYFHEHRLTASNFMLGMIGMALLVSGIAFRLWAIQVLGKYFTATVQVQNGQKIIAKGPYAIVRHPSYLGAYIAVIGSAIFLRTRVAVMVAALAMFWAYRFRIEVEERALLHAFGEIYERYQRRTRRMIPFIW